MWKNIHVQIQKIQSGLSQILVDHFHLAILLFLCLQLLFLWYVYLCNNTICTYLLFHIFKYIFLSQWYLQRRLPDRTFLLKPWLQCIISMWTVICSLTRIGDNRHHWWDVLAGVILGFAFSMLTVRVLCRKFHLNRNVSNMYSDSVENRQINFNKRKQNVKKLLHETTVDSSESRELKNVKSSTWSE